MAVLGVPRMSASILGILAKTLSFPLLTVRTENLALPPRSLLDCPVLPRLCMCLSSFHCLFGFESGLLSDARLRLTSSLQMIIIQKNLKKMILKLALSLFLSLLPGLPHVIWGTSLKKNLERALFWTPEL
jgi:hypothetical protein